MLQIWNTKICLHPYCRFFFQGVERNFVIPVEKQALEYHRFPSCNYQIDNKEHYPRGYWYKKQRFIDLQVTQRCMTQ
jgi:hypothetical protein